MLQYKNGKCLSLKTNIVDILFHRVFFRFSMPDRLSLNFSHGNIKRIILNFRLIILPFSTDVGDDIENTV